MSYFLEITCEALIIGCLINPYPDPPADRHYQTRRECNEAALQIERRFNTNKDDWRLRCLPLKR